MVHINHGHLDVLLMVYFVHFPSGTQAHFEIFMLTYSFSSRRRRFAKQGSTPRIGPNPSFHRCIFALRVGVHFYPSRPGPRVPIRAGQASPCAAFIRRNQPPRPAGAAARRPTCPAAARPGPAIAAHCGQPRQVPSLIAAYCGLLLRRERGDEAAGPASSRRQLRACLARSGATAFAAQRGKPRAHTGRAQGFELGLKLELYLLTNKL